MGTIMHSQSLQNVIRRKFDNGRLPTKAPIKLEVHRGSGAMCDACGAEIRTIDIEHEFNYHNGRPFRLHFECAALWAPLCRERGLDLPS
jgi:hypothetical protein